MRILMTVFLVAGVVLGIGSAVRHHHHHGVYGHRHWRSHHPCVSDQAPVPKQGPSEQPK